MSVRFASRRLASMALVGCLSLALVACSGSNNNKNSALGASTPPAPPTLAATEAPSATAAASILTPFPTISIPIATLSPAASSRSTPVGAATVLAGGLARLALQASDLPSGFALTASGPGGAELGQDVIASFEQEFQQRDVTSTAALQQTIVIINLIGQYRDTASAKGGVQSVNQQSLDQLLGSASITAEAATIPAIGEDSAGYHFSGTTGGASVGGYVIVFHRGPLAALVVTGAVKGAENLQQTIDLAQKQDQKIQSGG